MRNALLEGDCLDRLPELPARSVNLVLCDLPYGTTQNRWDSLVDLDRLWAEYRRVLAPGGVVILTGQGAFTARLILSNEAWFRFKLVWQKSKPTNFLNAKKQPLRAHEDVCVFYPSPPTYHPQMRAGEAYDKGVRKAQQTGSYGEFKQVRVKSEGARWPTDIVYAKTAEAEGPVWHPTQKPVELGRYLVRTWSNPGDLVLDNAFGAGSFLVAALAEGRDFVGIELPGAQAFFKERGDFNDEPLSWHDITRRRLAGAWHATPPLLRSRLSPSPLLSELDATPPDTAFLKRRQSRARPRGT